MRLAETKKLDCTIDGTLSSKLPTLDANVANSVTDRRKTALLSHTLTTWGNHVAKKIIA